MTTSDQTQPSKRPEIPVRLSWSDAVDEVVQALVATGMGEDVARKKLGSLIRRVEHRTVVRYKQLHRALR